MQRSTSNEAYFQQFRQHIIGINERFRSPHNGLQRLLYADWTASGRMYGPIERMLVEEVYPLVANTHTETNYTGKAMTQAYQTALVRIKAHVNASAQDVAICSNSGMTGVQNKLLRILGLRIHEKFKGRIEIPVHERPVVFITHMEHHSNQTSWLESICDVEIIQPCPKGLVDLDHFAELLERYADRPMKIASVTACSNVTGIITPYYHVAEMIHRAGGLCFVDFACSAPYVDIDMHPADPLHKLDAIYFSPHKFLGGPGSSGVLVFDHALYGNRVPDEPGGGTVEWTTPWKKHRYVEQIEAREDGGTPAFLQTIRAAMAIGLKESMGVENMLEREREQMDILWPALNAIPGLHVLANNVRDRLTIISFYMDGLHHDLGVKMLNDRFGIQVRGGCSCAGTYGHYLLNVTEEHSHTITDMIDHGDLTLKPGWIRLSIHPTTTDRELYYIVDSITKLAADHKQWAREYTFDAKSGDLCYAEPRKDADINSMVNQWFDPANFSGVDGTYGQKNGSNEMRHRILAARKQLVAELVEHFRQLELVLEHMP